MQCDTLSESLGVACCGHEQAVGWVYLQVGYLELGIQAVDQLQSRLTRAANASAAP